MKGLKSPGRRKRKAPRNNIVAERNRKTPKYVDENKGLKDFYDKKKDPEVTDAQRDRYKKMLAELLPREKRLLKTNKHLTVANFENNGGVIMPILVELHFENGKKETHNIPAEIWKKNHKSVSKLFVTRHPVVKILVDPTEQTADAKKENNVWPPQIAEVPFTLERPGKSFDNEMKRARAKEADRSEEKGGRREKESGCR